MDVGLDDRPIHAQFAATGNLECPCQQSHVIQQGVQRIWLDQVGPADEGGIIGHGLLVDSAELAQAEAVVDPELGGLIAPVVEMLRDEQA